MNIAIIGCGSVGEKRLHALGSHRLLYAVDKDIKRAQLLCQIRKQGHSATDWESVLASPELELVIIATTNDVLSKITAAALRNNKHVLVEKPAGRNLDDLKKAAEALRETDAFVKVGFNLRFHPALLKAKEIVSSGSIGNLMFIRGKYGHGGRLGYEKEWRLNRELAGGGALLDQGIHLIDLSRWIFQGEFDEAEGYAGTFFWDTELEDNGFVRLQTKKNQIGAMKNESKHQKSTKHSNICACVNRRTSPRGVFNQRANRKIKILRFVKRVGYF